MTLDQPKAPRQPGMVPTGHNRGEARPDDVSRKKGETDEEYGARPAVEQRVANQRQWDTYDKQFIGDLQRYQAANLEYERSLGTHQGRVMSYAQLVGMFSVFGNMAVRVEITPLDQDMLPGFVVGLLSETAVAE